MPQQVRACAAARLWEPHPVFAVKTASNTSHDGVIFFVCEVMGGFFLLQPVVCVLSSAACCMCCMRHGMHPHLQAVHHQPGCFSEVLRPPG